MKGLSRNGVLGAIALGLVFTTGYFATANAGPTDTYNTDVLDLMADHPGGWKLGKESGRGSNRDRLFEQLNLSQDQLSEIRTIREASRTTMQPLREQVRVGHQELRSLMASDASADEIRQRHSALAALDQQLRSERFEVMLQIREVLTPEQRAQLGQMLERSRSQKRQSHHNRSSRTPRS